MKTYAGIDLHSSNNFLGIIDENDNRLFSKRLSNELEEVLRVLAPYKESMEAVVVESTYNWYWLVDGLMEHGYQLCLANPSAIKQYEGLKNIDDKWDSFWLAHMKRLGILKVGYIYPREDRYVRDLLRRRMLFVQQQSAQIISLESLHSRVLGVSLKVKEVKKLKPEGAKELFDNDALSMIAEEQTRAITCLKSIITRIEKKVKAKIKLREEYQSLLSIPGIGMILAMTIMLEVGDINRFKTVGDYVSYCRCAAAIWTSNNKTKGKGNRKNGNKYLAWAYVEAANFCIRFCPEAKRFYQRKAAKSKKVVAIKALSRKLARASYYVIRDKISFDPNLLFK